MHAWRGDRQVEVTGIVDDSRRAGPGCLFVAIPGITHDGHAYAAAALERGAVALMVERELPDLAAPQAVVPNARRALGQVASAFYGHPSRHLRLIGVTGTDGKTTTIYLVYSILQKAGYKVGFVSTVQARIGSRSLETGLHTTTPEALDLQRYLAEMVEAGSEYALLEVSSHALDQERVAGCDFDLALITNLSHEHLDYHGTPAQYLATKAKLFRSLAGAHRKPGVPKTAILNRDDASYDTLRSIAVDQQYTYALDRPADFRASDIRITPDGGDFLAHTPRGRIGVHTQLLGRFNVYNALAALAIAESQGIATDAIQQGIEAVGSVPGRMERIDEGQDFTLLVDFAVTPNALRGALEVARSLTDGRVIVMFGCAGLRDAQKRPIMGEIAGRLADAIVITADDPRTEDLAAIMRQIATGCEAAGRRERESYWMIGDREEAIAFAVELARPGDVVLLAGKGHERSLAIGNEERPWNEADIARCALRDLSVGKRGTRH